MTTTTRARKLTPPASGDPFNTVEQTIMARRSVRLFQKKQVPEYLVERVLEAARYAPSAGNNQSWRFIVLRDAATMSELTDHVIKMAGILNRSLNRTAPDAYLGKKATGMLNRMLSYSITSTMHPTGLAGLSQLANGELDLWHGAPTVILCLIDTRGTGKPMLDLGIAGQNMVLAAHSMGLGTCWVSFAMFLQQSRKYRKLLGIEYPYKLVSSIALGFPKGQPDGYVQRETRESLWIESGGRQVIHS